MVADHGWPSRRLDLLAGFDLIFRHGIDTLHGFRRPAFATPFYQRVIRRLAGYGAPPSATASVGLTGPPTLLDVDTVIVGAGRSGRAVAGALVAAGLHPLVVERRLQPPPIPGADLLTATTATFLPPRVPTGDPPFEILGSVEPGRGLRIRARRVVVATGSYDGGLLFESSDRPGVVTADGALAMRDGRGQPPFRRAVVFGSGDRAKAALEQLGDHVVAVASPTEVPPDLVAEANRHGALLYPRSLILGVGGRRRVRSVTLRSRGDGTTTEVDADALVLAHRRLPNSQLFFQAGARVAWRAGTGAYYPIVGDDGTTSVPGLWAVGSAAGATTSGSIGSGERTGASLTGGSVPLAPIERIRSEGPNDMEGYYRDLLRESRTGRWIVCPCEDVLLGEVEHASRSGYRGMEVIKRYTGVGTGLCQGRYCVPDTLLLLALLEQRTPTEVGYLTQRPPVHPTPLAALAALNVSEPISEGP